MSLHKSVGIIGVIGGALTGVALTALAVKNKEEIKEGCKRCLEFSQEKLVQVEGHIAKQAEVLRKTIDKVHIGKKSNVVEINGKQYIPVEVIEKKIEELSTNLVK